MFTKRLIAILILLSLLMSSFAQADCDSSYARAIEGIEKSEHKSKVRWRWAFAGTLVTAMGTVMAFKDLPPDAAAFVFLVPIGMTLANSFAADFDDLELRKVQLILNDAKSGRGVSLKKLVSELNREESIDWINSHQLGEIINQLNARDAFCPAYPKAPKVRAVTSYKGAVGLIVKEIMNRPKR